MKEIPLTPWNAKSQKWRVVIQCEYKSYHVGGFSDERQAALAYNEKARELFGEFAWLNKVA